MKTLLIFILLTSCFGYANPNDKTLPDKIKIEEKTKQDSLDKVKADVEKTATKKDSDFKNEKRILPNISEDTIKTTSILFFVVMLVLIILFFLQAYLRNQYIGFQSIKFIGLVIMFPGICIIALVGGNLISGETLAALLGTIAGYVLSREDDSTKDSLKKENDTLKTKIKELEALIPKK